MPIPLVINFTPIGSKQNNKNLIFLYIRVQYRTPNKKQESGQSLNFLIFFFLLASSIFSLFSCFRRTEIMLVPILVLKRDSFMFIQYY